MRCAACSMHDNIAVLTADARTTTTQIDWTARYCKLRLFMCYTGGSCAGSQLVMSGHSRCASRHSLPPCMSGAQHAIDVNSSCHNMGFSVGYISVCRRCTHPQEWVETERACYLIRQHVYANLSHRLGTRPFLSHLEKVCRPRGICLSPWSSRLLLHAGFQRA